MKLVGILLALTLSATPALAGPRSDEVNDRLANQHDRIDDGREDGQLTRGEARHLHRQDRSIHRQERRMKRRDGGLTRHDQRVLNHRENRVSRRIRRERAR